MSDLRQLTRVSWCQLCETIAGHGYPDSTDAVFHVLEVAEGVWGAVTVEQHDHPALPVADAPVARVKTYQDRVEVFVEWPLPAAREVVDALAAAVENLETIVSLSAADDGSTR